MASQVLSVLMFRLEEENKKKIAMDDRSDMRDFKGPEIHHV
jgi:hypothetical protein